MPPLPTANNNICLPAGRGPDPPPPDSRCCQGPLGLRNRPGTKSSAQEHYEHSFPFPQLARSTCICSVSLRRSHSSSADDGESSFISEGDVHWLKSAHFLTNRKFKLVHTLLTFQISAYKKDINNISVFLGTGFMPGELHNLKLVPNVKLLGTSSVLAYEHVSTEFRGVYWIRINLSCFHDWQKLSHTGYQGKPCQAKMACLKCFWCVMAGHRNTRVSYVKRAQDASVMRWASERLQERSAVNVKSTGSGLKRLKSNSENILCVAVFMYISSDAAWAQLVDDGAMCVTTAQRRQTFGAGPW